MLENSVGVSKVPLCLSRGERNRRAKSIRGGQGKEERYLRGRSDRRLSLFDDICSEVSRYAGNSFQCIVKQHLHEVCVKPLLFNDKNEKGPAFLLRSLFMDIKTLT